MTKKIKILIITLTLFAFSCTSVGGVYLSTVYAADLESEQDKVEVSKDVSQGLLALGLFALISKGHKSSDKPKTNEQVENAGYTPPPEKSSASGSSDSQSSQVPSTKPATTTAPSTVQGLTLDEKKAIDLVNADRAKNGLKPLKINMDLVLLARNYSQDMANRGFFSHYNPEGQSPFDRMRAAGISFSYAGENLAINQSVTGAETAFMNSPGHRANILNTNYTEIGIGIAYKSNGSIYVTQEFIRP